MKSLEKIASALSADAWFFMDDNVVTFSELIKVSEYEPPSEIMEFITEPKNLPYIVLAKKISEEGLSPEIWEKVFNHFKQITNLISKKRIPVE